MPKRESRATVGLIAPVSRPRIGSVWGVTAHWNGPAMGMAGKPHSSCRQAWRNVQRFHMGRNYRPNPLSTGRHWADVAYSTAVCHHGVAMEGRGPNVRTAANGTNSGNDHWYAIFFMVGGNEEPSKEMIEAARWYADAHLGTTNWNRHTDHKSTTCAGTVNKYIANGNLTTRGAGSSGAGQEEEDVAPKDWDNEDWEAVHQVMNNMVVKHTELNFAWHLRFFERAHRSTLDALQALTKMVENHASESGIDSSVIAREVADALGEDLNAIARDLGVDVANVTAEEIIRKHGEALVAGAGGN